MPMLMLAAYLHRLDPFAIEFAPGIGVRWYGLSYLAGFVLAYLVMRRIVRLGHSTLTVPDLNDLVFYIAVGVIVGGRLGYACFYDPALWVTFTHDLPFWGLLALNHGGMASHGGMIGAVAATGFFAWRRHHSWGHLLDLAALGTPIGLGLGRIANFINGELYGRPCAAHFPFAVQFPSEMLVWDPTQWQHFLHEAGPAAADLTTSQIIAAIHAGNPALVAAARLTLTPRYPSQLFEALAEGLVLFIVLLAVYARPRKPWFVGSVFLMTYAVLRIVCEQFREPDAGIGYQALGLTRGQWLSVGLIVAGLAIMTMALLSRAKPLGGWRSSRT